MITKIRPRGLLLIASGAGNRGYQVHATRRRKKINLNSPPAQNVGRLCNVE